MEKQEKRYPKGHFIGWGVALGIPLGIPFWLVTGNPGLIGAGIAVGIAIGVGLENKYNKNPRPLTEQEKKNRKIATIFGALFLVLGIIAFLFMLF
jgi:hypothetical protein